MYVSKEECHLEILASLITGVLHEEDLGHLMRHYEELEMYECCQGIAEAYAEYKERIKLLKYET